MAINKSASKIGNLVFNNGNRLALYIGANSNTGETIVWQVLNGGKSKRVTGKNVSGLATELAEVLTTNAGGWVGEVNAAALACLTRLA